MRITVYNDGYQDGAFYADYKMIVKDFNIVIIDHCEPTSYTQTTKFSPISLVYTVADVNAAQATFSPTWTTVPAEC